MATIESIVLSPEEKEVVTYHCSRLRKPKSDGHLTVTNNRVIFHGWGSGSRIVQEVDLTSISGLSTFYGSRLNRLLLFVGGISLLAAALMFINPVFAESVPDIYYYQPRLSAFEQVMNWALPILFSIIGLVCLRNCYRRAFHLQIFSSQANGSPISVGAGPNGLLGNTAALSLIAEPTNQTDAMMLELGSLIQDLKKLGDRAIPRWHEKWYKPLEGLEAEEDE